MKLTNDSSSSFIHAKTKVTENKRPFVTEEEGKALSKKPANTSAKNNKGLKRNLKNWEAFIEEDEEDEDTGLSFDVELDLGLDVSRNRQPEAKKRKQA